MYKIKLPIGDWSNDGHGKCDYYNFVSNKPVNEVREIHFKMYEVSGVDINKICNRYDEYFIDKEVLEKLEELGLPSQLSLDIKSNKYRLDSYMMVDIWAFLLRKTDPTLEFNFIGDVYENLVFYGYDEKKRHMNGIGYGLFE